MQLVHNEATADVVVYMDSAEYAEFSAMLNAACAHLAGTAAAAEDAGLLSLAADLTDREDRWSELQDAFTGDSS